MVEIMTLPHPCLFFSLTYLLNKGEFQTVYLYLNYITLYSEGCAEVCTMYFASCLAVMMFKRWTFCY